MEAREFFMNFPVWMKIAFYVVGLSTVVFFVAGFWLRIKKYKRGSENGRFNNVGGRFFKALGKMTTNSTVMKRDVRMVSASFSRGTPVSCARSTCRPGPLTVKQ